MRLVPGSRIGAHVVVSLIGEGGMGEVHRARDTTLDRDVAIKRLPDSVAGDPERLARFESIRIQISRDPERPAAILRSRLHERHLSGMV